MLKVNPPLQVLINQINGAAKAGMHLVAIGMAVSLPAICASLAKEDGRSQRDDYLAWCAENLSGPEFGFVTPNDLYSMRCGVLHQGRYGGLTHSVARVVFTVQGGMTDCMANDAYLYSASEFCMNLCKAAGIWFEANKTNPIVAANIARMMQYYPDVTP